MSMSIDMAKAVLEQAAKEVWGLQWIKNGPDRKVAADQLAQELERIAAGIRYYGNATIDRHRQSGNDEAVRVPLVEEVKSSTVEQSTALVPTRGRARR